MSFRLNLRKLLKRYRSTSRARSILSLLIAVFLVLGVPVLVLAALIQSQRTMGVAAAGSLRGTAGDLWADIEIGKRDFGEIGPGEIVPYKLYNPGGIIVDRSVSPGRAYVWDSGNNRILGLDLGTCYGQASPCSANIVIGQPQASDYGACNLDSSFQTNPSRPPASASTLCGLAETTQTTLEDGTQVGMFVDPQGNLFVPDARNNRVLKFNGPFTTDVVADEVWGQPDFAGNGCNITGGAIGGGFPPDSHPAPAPTASSLCFQSIGAGGAGVAQDASGNLWVADGGNNRVLRFPKDPGTGVIAKTADLVLGQANLTSGGDWSYCEVLPTRDCMARMWAPTALRFDSSGKLYVVDSSNNRILVFTPPFTSGMAATSTFGTGFTGITSLEIDPGGGGIWTLDNDGWDARLRLWDLSGVLQKTLPKPGNKGTGQIGIDASGNILHTLVPNGWDVYRYTPQVDGSYLITKHLFSPPYGPNTITSRRLEHPAWVGVTTAANQLIVGVGRLLFWNDLTTLTNGKPADGYVGAASFTEQPDPQFTQVKSDNSNRVWAVKGSQILVYQAPLNIGSTPIKTITSPINALGGGQVTLSADGSVRGIAVSPDGNFLWISEPSNSRVLRVRDPLTTPVVDVVLGQTDLVGNQCNRGVVPPPSSGTPLTADLTMLCWPGALSIDRRGNLYVSDHVIESAGNFRLLMFANALFPPTPSAIIFAPTATKEFPRAMGTNTQSHATFEVAFDGLNRMVTGYNPYLGPRFPEFYNDPTRVNPSNPSDPTYALPDGTFKDFYGWAVAATFDNYENLYLFDANRGQVRVYKNPFNNPTPTPTPAPCTATCVSAVTTGNCTQTTPCKTSSQTLEPLPKVTYTINSNSCPSGIAIDASTNQFTGDNVPTNTWWDAAYITQGGTASADWNFCNSTVCWGFDAGQALYWRLREPGTNQIKAICSTYSVPGPTPTPTPNPPAPTPTPTPGDTTAPTVIIIAPTNGTVLPSTGTVQVIVFASDASGIGKIDIFVDGGSKKSCFGTTSCSYGWNVSKVPLGSHTIWSRATDNSPNKNVGEATITVYRQ